MTTTDMSDGIVPPSAAPGLDVEAEARAKERTTIGPWDRPAQNKPPRLPLAWMLAFGPDEKFSKGNLWEIKEYLGGRYDKICNEIGRRLACAVYTCWTFRVLLRKYPRLRWGLRLAVILAMPTSNGQVYKIIWFYGTKWFGLS
jgi:hypothetical protein